MARFLRENWLYIVVPIVVVIAAVAVLLVLSEGDSGATFTYDLF
jgi:hypothetical protein